MLIESTAHLPISLAIFQDIFHAPNSESLLRIIFRWAHFVAGITWIGLLYFFNLVNVPVQKALDPETKKKVNPDLLSRALWYFRWGAVFTVLAGLAYFAMYILKGDVANANTLGGGHVNLWLVLIVWLIIPCVAFAIEFLIIKKVAAITKDGRVFAVVVIILIIGMCWAILCYLEYALTVNGENWTSNKTFSIGLGGAMGVMMMLNVWGIIWPNQKKILGLAPATDEQKAAARKTALLASRTNFVLSIPMLMCMGGQSHGLPF